MFFEETQFPKPQTLVQPPSFHDTFWTRSFHFVNVRNSSLPSTSGGSRAEITSTWFPVSINAWKRRVFFCGPIDEKVFLQRSAGTHHPAAPAAPIILFTNWYGPTLHLAWSTCAWRSLRGTQHPATCPKPQQFPCKDL